MLRQLAPVAPPVSLKELALSSMSDQSSIAGDVHLFEREAARLFGVEHSIATSSGRSALTLILKMLHGELAKKEVIIPAYSCPSIAASVVKAGLTVTLCDLEENGFGYDQKSLAMLLSGDTLAVVFVDLFGYPTASDSAIKMIRDKGATIIEDRAQSAMTVNTESFRPQKGDFAFYSFGRGKNITTGGGGVITTRNSVYAGKLRTILREEQNGSALQSFSVFMRLAAYSIFVNPALYSIPRHMPFLKLGETIYSTDFNMSALSPFQSRLGMRMIQKLDFLNVSRTKKAAYYHEHLNSLKGVTSFNHPENGVNLRYPIIIEDDCTRDNIYRESLNKGLGITKMYPKTLDTILAIIPKLGRQQFYPHADRMSKTLLTLPTHHLVQEKDMSLR